MPLSGNVLSALLEAYPIGGYGSNLIAGDTPDIDTGTGLNREVGYTKPAGGGSVIVTGFPAFSVVPFRKPASSFSKIAGRFVAPQDATLEDVTFTFDRTGSPTGTLTVTLCSDSSGNPGATLATLGTMDVATVAVFPATATLVPAVPPSISSGVSYWIVVESDSVLSALDYLSWYLASASNPNTDMFAYNAAWVDLGYDPIMDVSILGVDNYSGEFALQTLDLGASSTIALSTFMVAAAEADSTPHLYRVAVNDTEGYDVTAEPLKTLTQVQALGNLDGQFLHMTVTMEIGDADANPVTTFSHATVNIQTTSLLVPHQVCSADTQFPNNTLDGYQKLTDTTIVPEFVVEGLVGPVAIPLSVLREWTNDFGKRLFGGAAYISIFENGGNETTPGTLISTVNQSAIETVGSFEVLQVDVERRYEVVVRLRSSVNDPNYRDFIFPFYLHTQQGVPLRITLLDDADFPEIEYDVSVADQFTWATIPGAAINEAWLRTGQGRAGLPIVSTPWTDPFNAETKTHIFKLFQQGGGYFAIDFVVGTISAVTRVFYEVVATGSDPSLEIHKRKRANFTIPGYDNAIVPSDIEATIDRDAGEAYLVITSVDPDTADLRYEAVSVAGSLGSMSINPAAAKYGGTYDISSVIDFNAVTYAPRMSYLDDSVWLLLVTDSKITCYKVPLTEEQPKIIARSSDFVNSPPAAAMVWRHMCVGGTGTYIRWENAAAFTDPPEVSNITIVELDSSNTVNYLTHAALSAVLSTQDFGVEGGALDNCLNLTTQGILGAPATVDHSGWTIQYDLDDGVTVETLTQYVPARFVEAATVLGSSGISQADLLYARMSQWPNLVIAMSSLSLDSVVVRGDIGEYSLSGAEIASIGSGDTTINVRDYVSREADNITLSYLITAGDAIVVRLPKYPEITLISGDPDNVINVLLTNDALIFPEGAFTGKLDATQPVTVYGDIGSQVIPATVVENSLYDIYWSGVLSSSLFVPYIELGYTDLSAGAMRIRVPNRLGYNHSIKNRPFVEAPKGGWGMSGLYARSLQAQFPSAKINPATQELVFNTVVGGGIRYDHIAVLNTRTGIWFNIVEDQVRPMQGGYVYQLGAAGVGLRTGDYMVVVFRHTNGTQGVAAYKADNTYQEATRADRLQGRF